MSPSLSPCPHPYRSPLSPSLSPCPFVPCRFIVLCAANIISAQTKPATVPTHVDRSIARSIDRSLGGGSHGDPRSKKNHGKLTQESSRNRPKIVRKTAKAIKNRSSGTLRGAQGTRGRKLMNNRRKSDFADPPPEARFGTLGRHWAPLGRHFLHFGVES